MGSNPRRAALTPAVRHEQARPDVLLRGRRRQDPRPAAHRLQPRWDGEPDNDILEHDWKPQVELRLLVLRDDLEELGYSEAEIDLRVEEERKAAETEAVAAEGRPRAQGEGHWRQLGVRPAQALAHDSIGRTEENANTCISLFLGFLRKHLLFDFAGT